MSRAQAKDAGDSLEATVISGRPELESVPDSEAEWHDARTTTLVEATPELPMAGILLVEAGTPVEIKAAQVRIKNGGSETIRGRWYIKRAAHDRLLAAGGVYYLVVYEPESRAPLAAIVVPARSLEALVTWTPVGSARSEQLVAKLSWGALLAPDAVEAAGGVQA